MRPKGRTLSLSDLLVELDGIRGFDDVNHVAGVVPFQHIIQAANARHMVVFHGLRRLMVDVRRATAVPRQRYTVVSISFKYPWEKACIGLNISECKRRATLSAHVYQRAVCPHRIGWYRTKRDPFQTDGYYA